MMMRPGHAGAAWSAVMTSRDQFRKVSSVVRGLRRNGASHGEYPLLLRAAGHLHACGDIEASRMAKYLHGHSHKLGGFECFPVGWEFGAQPLSVAHTFARYKGYLCPGILNGDGWRFVRLVGRKPTPRAPQGWD